MPTGFSLGTPSPDNNTQGAGDSACAKRYAVLSNSNSPGTTKADRDFDQGGLMGSYVTQSLSAFRSDSGARVSFDRFVSVLTECPAFTSVDKAGKHTDYTFAALSFPKLGDQTFAAKLTAKSADVTASGDVVATRDGPLVQLVLDVSLTGPDITITEKVVRAGFAKLHGLR